jgi:hypothetical protein
LANDCLRADVLLRKDADGRLMDNESLKPAAEYVRAACALAAVVFTAGLFLEGRVVAPPAQEQPATLRVGATLQVRGGKTSLTFLAVERDSRCPKGTRCIRAGEAVVVFSLRGNDGRASTLTFEVPPSGGASQSFEGYRIQIIGLDPQAEADVEIAPADYVATVAIQKA